MILSINISISDWIQIIIAFITFLGIITSIIIALCTLKQNSKMIEETTRPVVVIFKDVIHINSPKEYLVIKNFGSSMAFIASIQFDKNKFDKIDNGIKGRFKELNNITLAPNQKYFFPISTKKDLNITEIEFLIKYKSSTNKLYNEKYIVNLAQDRSVCYDKHHLTPKKVENELETIDNTLQELLKRI